MILKDSKKAERRVYIDTFSLRKSIKTMHPLAEAWENHTSSLEAEYEKSQARNQKQILSKKQFRGHRRTWQQTDVRQSSAERHFSQQEPFASVTRMRKRKYGAGQAGCRFDSHRIPHKCQGMGELV